MKKGPPLASLTEIQKVSPQFPAGMWLKICAANHIEKNKIELQPAQSTRTHV
jgi:hypothetical protein